MALINKHINSYHHYCITMGLCLDLYLKYDG